MVYIKDGKKYYTMEESSQILDERINKNAKEFAKKVVSMNKANRVGAKEYSYV